MLLAMVLGLARFDTLNSFISLVCASAEWRLGVDTGVLKLECCTEEVASLGKFSDLSEGDTFLALRLSDFLFFFPIIGDAGMGILAICSSCSPLSALNFFESALKIQK